MPYHSDTAIVILAAGKGTRMRSELAKVLHRAGGRTLVEHVIRACLPLKAAQILVVVGHQADEVGAVAENLGAQAILQKPQHGTGHAMQVARRAIRQERESGCSWCQVMLLCCAANRWLRFSIHTAAAKRLPQCSARSLPIRRITAGSCGFGRTRRGDRGRKGCDA